ncbi:hypothetical protein [Mycoplasmoides fastidiosum]|uniref:hypothetical protein n=1 Tax=Mycoplasmoides fastidiosum TaxID=92758 RepID=UPI0021147948|nr:hypothetical protein [Mycoplasmoides fastidiosum]UUD38112.1 hypothetical protein NPA10_01870 [Mycoplasmoides fastidiosum]
MKLWRKFKWEKNKKSKKDENNSSSKKSEIDENEKIKIKTLNDILVTNDYIVEKQLKLWNPNKHSTTKVKGVINNYFKREDYRKELEIILKKQSHFADEIFRENFLKIFDRQREFQLGPGGPKSPTEYGLWQEVNGKIEKKDENLWEKNIRKCLIYQNENVAPKKSFSNYLFSVLCYLNNLTCNNEKLSYESKNRLLHENFDFVKIKFSNISNNRILKKFKQQLDNEELKIDDIYGFATELKSSKNNKEKLAIPKKFPYTNELLKEIYLKILNSEFKLKSTFAKENDFFSRNQKLIDLIDLIIIFLSKFVTKKIRLNNFQNETEIHNLFGELFDSSNFKKSLRKFSEEIKGIQNISGTASLSLKGLKKN